MPNKKMLHSLWQIVKSAYTILGILSTVSGFYLFALPEYVEKLRLRLSTVGIPMSVTTWLLYICTASYPIYVVYKIVTYLRKRYFEKSSPKEEPSKVLIATVNGLERYVAEHEGTITERINNIEKLFEKIERGMPVKENIETVMVQTEFLARVLRQTAEDCLTKTRMFNRAADTWAEMSLQFEVSPEKTFEKTVPVGYGMAVYAVKFLSGDGYGKYDMFVNGGKRNCWFTKRQKGNEDGVIFFSRLLFLQAQDRLHVVQTYGEGELKASLYLFIAGSHEMVVQLSTIDGW